MRISSVVLVLALVAAAPAQEGESHLEGGWRVYMAARAAAGGGPGGPTLKDYAFDLKTQITTQGREVALESHVELIVPYLFRQEIVSQAGSTTMIFDGERGWQKTASGERDLPESSVELQRSDLDRAHILLGPLPDQKSVRLRGAETVDRRPVDVIEIADVGGTPLHLYIDQESRDVLKQTFEGKVPNGTTAQVEEIFSDFQTVGGFRWHMSKRTLRNGKEAVRSVTSNLRVNTGLTREQIVR